MTVRSFDKVVDQPIDRVEPAVRDALAAQGFGVLTEIDVAATLKAKLGVDRPPLKILGACNPSLAHRALEIDPAVRAGASLQRRASRRRRKNRNLDRRSPHAHGRPRVLRTRRRSCGEAHSSPGISGQLRLKRPTEMPRAPLPHAEFEEIYAKVPRLTAEVVIVSPDGVLLARRHAGPCQGLWHIPGGTVRFGEPLTDAVQRVAEEELGVDVTIDDLLGYIEYPSHLERGLDWPVGIVFGVHLASSSANRFRPTPGAVSWFLDLPHDMHDEQKLFLTAHGLAVLP